MFSYDLYPSMFIFVPYAVFDAGLPVISVDLDILLTELQKQIYVFDKWVSQIQRQSCSNGCDMTMSKQ